MAYNEEKEKSCEDLWGLGRFYLICVLGAPYYQGGYIEWVGEVQIIENLFLIQLARKLRTYLVSRPGSSQPSISGLCAGLHRRLSDMFGPRTRHIRSSLISPTLSLFFRHIWPGHRVPKMVSEHIRSLDPTCLANPFFLKGQVICRTYPS
jgi:hypothetical protein